MKFMGFEIRKAPERKPDISSGSQFRPGLPQGPLTSYFQDLVVRRVSGGFYEFLREGVPIFDAAINRLVSLNGTLEPCGEDADLVKELEDICRSIPVNDLQKGIQALRGNYWNETFEQGFAQVEFIPTPDLKDIAGTRVADSKDIVFRRNRAGGLDAWYRPYSPLNPKTLYSSPQTLIEQILTATYNQSLSLFGINEIKLNPANKLYFSINNENSDPYGTSIMRSAEFCAKILVTMQNSIGNVWERFGDPSYQVLYKASKAGSGDLANRQSTLKTDFANTISAKRQGKSADFVYAVDKDSDISVKVIGHDNQVLEIEAPARHVLEQIVSKTGLPAWMLGIYWSTTERMAQLEVEMVLQDAVIRQQAEIPEMIRLFSTILQLRGYKWKTITTDPNKRGDWGFYYKAPNLHEIVAQAQAEFLRAQADMMRRGQGNQPGQIPPAATVRNQGQEVPVGQASIDIGGIKFPVISAKGRAQRAEGNCGCGKAHGDHKHEGKELNRTKPWPELDKVEDEYEKELKYDWNELRGKIFKILGLKDPAPESSSASSVNSVVKDVKAFEFTDDQRKAILDALKEYLGWYEPSDPDSPVRWAYGQSYSLGLIQAAELVGSTTPILDTLKNKEIFDELVRSGFDLVKNNATRVIKEEVMMAMGDGMTQGVNPKDVARTLDDIFDGANSDWERLARTEMTIAAEKAKKDEWEERGVDTSGAVIAGQDTHPRCRCANTVKDDGNGNFRMVFSPAPDACSICFALAAGD